MRLLQTWIAKNHAQFASATPVTVAGGHTLPIKSGDIVEYRCPLTGLISLGMVLTCNQALMFYISVYDIKEGKKTWIRAHNILRLKTI